MKKFIKIEDNKRVIGKKWEKVLFIPYWLFSFLTLKFCQQNDSIVYYDILLKALGGNPASPVCDGKPANSTVKDLLSNLEACPKAIDEACVSTVNVPEECAEKTRDFDTDYKACAKKASDEDFCNCIAILDFEPIADCKREINPAFRNSNNERKACINNVFSNCKKNISEVAIVASECSSKSTTDTTSGTTATTATSAPPPATSCDEENNVYICQGNDVKDAFKVADFEECSRECFLNPQCVGWTYESEEQYPNDPFVGFCWLKNSDKCKVRY